MENKRFHGVFDEYYLASTNKRTAILNIIETWVKTQGNMIFDCNNELYGIQLVLDEPIDAIDRIYLSYESDSERESTRALLFIKGDHRSVGIHEDDAEQELIETIVKGLGLVTPTTLNDTICYF